MILSAIARGITAFLRFRDDALHDKVGVWNYVTLGKTQSCAATVSDSQGSHCNLIAVNLVILLI